MHLQGPTLSYMWYFLAFMNTIFSLLDVPC